MMFARKTQELRPNCLLTRYPICFVHGRKHLFNARNYWNGIPVFLRDHGYETNDFKAAWRGPKELRLKHFSEQLWLVLKRHDKVHLVAQGVGTVDVLLLVQDRELAAKISSVTLVCAPSDALKTEAASALPSGLVSWMASPWPKGVAAACEMFLDHAILLAEHDYHTAK